MSIQSDIEMLSVRAMEEYAKRNHMSGREVIKLFHQYQVVADDNTMETVQLYISGILTANEAVERLRYNRVNNQVSFHTEKALESLSFVRRVAYGQ